MTERRIRVLWHWLAMGPYHFSRMNALAVRPEIDLTVVETASRGDHAWTRDKPSAQFPLITLSEDRLSSALMARTKPCLEQAFRAVRPDVIVAACYSEVHSRRAALEFAWQNPSRVSLLWSESTANDQQRSWLCEKVKGLLVRQFGGALVAGRAHALYLQSLGMPADRICSVGGCVDNERFAQRRNSDQCDGSPSHVRVPSVPYFLYVGRFIPQKNLARLLEAFRRYRKRCVDVAWDLVLVGGGAEEAQLRNFVCTWRVPGVHFPGFCQIEELSRLYARAGCFVLPSLVEPWGLVVNEAMAAGLPILLSRSCGCAAELVAEGRNGFLFRPDDIEGLGRLLGRVSAMRPEELEHLGAESRRTIGAFTPSRFAERAATHIQKVWLRSDELTSMVSLRRRHFKGLHFAHSLASLPLTRMPR